MNEILYLYGMVPADSPAPTQLTGIGDAAVELVRVGDVAAAVARVSAAAFAPELVEAHMQDLAWVGEQGLAHERVVLWFVDHAEILPARLFTMYSDETALRSALAPQQQRIARSLAALAGRREWNLKVSYNAAELVRHAADVSDEVRRLDEQIAAAPPGRRYLLQRKRAELAKRELAGAARRQAEQLLDALRSHADAVRVLPLAATDEPGTVVLQAALLVARDGEAALRADVERRAAALRELGMIVDFSGPWAAYRFVDGAANE